MLGGLPSVQLGRCESASRVAPRRFLFEQSCQHRPWQHLSGFCSNIHFQKWPGWGGGRDIYNVNLFDNSLIYNLLQRLLEGLKHILPRLQPFYIMYGTGEADRAGLQQPVVVAATVEECQDPPGSARKTQQITYYSRYLIVCNKRLVWYSIIFNIIYLVALGYHWAWWLERVFQVLRPGPVHWLRLCGGVRRAFPFPLCRGSGTRSPLESAATPISTLFIIAINIEMDRQTNQTNMKLESPSSISARPSPGHCAGHLGGRAPAHQRCP